MTNRNLQNILKLGISLSVLFTAYAHATEVTNWAELNSAASGDITVVADIQAEESPTTISLTSTSPQVIDGGGYSLTGASGYRIQKTSGTDLTIKNFGSIVNGSEGDYTYSYTDAEGNTVYKKITGSVNGFNQALFSSNTLTDLSISDTVFKNNTNRVVDILLNTVSDTASLSNVVFYGNQASITDQAVLTFGRGTFTIDNLIFDSNKATSGALGIDFYAGTYSTLNNSIIQNNKGNWYGAIQLSGGVVEINNSQFINNTTNYDGGAITVTATMNNINNSLFKGNKSFYSNGGAIWYSQFASSPVFTNTIFEDNEASDYGGALFMCGTGASTGTFWLESSSFSNNSTGILGGALYTESLDALHITNSEFTGNQAAYGGGIYVAEEPTTIADTNFTDNQAEEGAALYVENADVAVIADKRDVVFSGNTASNDSDDYNGGADIYFQANNADTTLSLNAAEGKKIVFNGSIASYYGDNDIPTIEINKSGVSYSTNDGETETVVAAGTAGEIQFKGQVGDEDNLFNVSVYDGTLTVASKMCVNDLDVQGGAMDIGNNATSVKTANFASGSTLALTVNSTEDYGSLTAEQITVASGATLKATLAQGIVEEGESATLQLLSAENEDFNNFQDSFDNNMYHFEKADQNGKYTITGTNSGSDVVGGEGGPAWVAEAAKAYVDGGQFAAGSVAADVANKLAYLAQNDAAAFVAQVKALAPMETAIVQGQAIEDVNRLFSAVDGYLRGERDPFGVSAGDEFSGAALWIKPYIGKSKLGNEKGVAGFDTSSRGFIAGVEKKIRDVWKLGIGLQYDETDIDAFSRDIDSKTKLGFIYGEYKPSSWFINSALSYARSTYDEKKYTLGSKYTAEYAIKTFSASAMTGYQFKYLVPEIGMRYYNIKQDSYKDSAQQRISGPNKNIVKAIAGVHFVTNYGMFYPDIHAGVTYDVINSKENTLVNLSNNTSYTVEGRKLPRLGYEFDIGVNAHITDNMIIGAIYTGSYRNHYQEHTGSLKFKYGF